MASNHVPSEQVPLQGQTIYTDPSYQNIFSSVDRFGSPSWESQLNHHSGLVPAPSPQSWHHGTYAQQTYNNSSQNYGSQNHNHGPRTASPYQYGQFGQPASLVNYNQASNVDPSLALDSTALGQQQSQQHQQSSQYSMHMRSIAPQTQATVTPQALQKQQHQNAVPIQAARQIVSPYQVPKSTAEQFAQQRLYPAPAIKTIQVPEYEIPRGKKSAGLHVLDQSALAKATKSVPLNKFITIGSDFYHLASNRTALPLYTARLSLKEAKKVGTVNKKLARLSSASSPSRARKLDKRLARATIGIKSDVSDSDSYTDSSDYDSDSSDEDGEVSPLPSSRSDEPHEAVRYDIIKATWFPRAAPVGSESIKSSLREFWDVLSTIQKRWRADTKALTDAEDQKKTGELPTLKSRVASQRDLLNSALRAALEHAHPDVLSNMGQVKQFLYLCYQFLANRFHNKDYDGTLSAAIFETMSRCDAVTNELLEETKAIKALISMKKHATEAHKVMIQKIIDTATANSKKAKSSSPPKSDPVESKGAKRPAVDATSSVSNGPASKKSRPSDVLATITKKDGVIATGNKSPSTGTGASVQKRPGEKTVAPSALIKARVSQVMNKPSGLFASLNAASKKPIPSIPSAIAVKPKTTSKVSIVAAKDKKTPSVTAASTSKPPAFSFAQTMASLQKPKEQMSAPAKTEKQLPSETAEERTKRLRKESRRHLRVTFRPDVSLVEIRYFSHAPEEDMGHAENLVRDAGDIGGEGRMFKQHKELDVDDDDDEVEIDQRVWHEPTEVDFSVVPIEERQRNYAPFGGGPNKPTCPEKEANIKRENATLMVIYLQPNDIPRDPREPLGEQVSPVTPVSFGTPSDLCLNRCPQVPVIKPAADLSSLENIFKQFSNSTTAQQPSPAPQPTPAPTSFAATPAPAATPDLAAILSALGAQNAAQAPAPMPAPAPILAPVQQSPLAPPAAFDLNALMAMMQAQAASGAPLPPPPPGLPPGFAPFPFAFPGQASQADAPSYQPPQFDGSGYQPQYEQQANGAAKRARDDVSYNAVGHGKRQKSLGAKPHKVLACKFYPKGMCNKGDSCTYIHDLNM